jgi:hypothetical protein
MSQELYKLLPFLKPISESATTTAEQRAQARQRKSSEQIRQGDGLTGQTKTKELYKLFPFLQTAATKTKKPEAKKTYPTVAELQTIKPSRDYQKEKEIETEIETDSNNTALGPRLDPNATERYASNFKAGQANMSDIQEMYADRKDLQEWAKANPALAQKEFAKSGFQSTRMKNADIQDQMDDTGRSRDDLIAINNGGLETVIDGSSIGKSTPQDAQAFKDAAAQLVVKGQLPSSMNAGSTPIIPGVTPMFEGNELSTAIEPGYKSEMADGVMNQLAKGLDIPTTRFASQDLKDLFMNNLLG